MSKAFKCDRCKKCFDPWETGDEQFEFGNISEYATITPVGISFDCVYRDEDIHFCPECNKAFALFMDNRSIVESIPVLGEAQKEINRLKAENEALRSYILRTKIVCPLRKNCNPLNEKDGV